MRLLCYIGISALLLSSCATNPYAKSNRSYKKQVKALTKTIRESETGAYTDSLGNSIPSGWVGTINFNLRKPNYVILHHTAQNSTAQTLKTFTLSKSQVSAHYLIGRDGQIIHLLNDYLRAWHGGIARWGNDTDINSNSIGIEIDNDGLAPFTETQIQSLLSLLKQLKKTYNIPTANFIAHSDIAPSRKVDPQIGFPWRRLADKGFGLMPDSLTLDPVPPNFDPMAALRIIGYDTREPKAAILAFKRHFLTKEDGTDWSTTDLQALYNLYCKY
ncbi:MAG: N-acetylmuramoyl-L-alanine amidase [Sphingobacteriaceae bacterium]